MTRVFLHKLINIRKIYLEIYKEVYYCRFAEVRKTRHATVYGTYWCSQCVGVLAGGRC
jgi:hypothetical protein